jgi:hypothetical protein
MPDRRRLAFELFTAIVVAACSGDATVPGDPGGSRGNGGQNADVSPADASQPIDSSAGEAGPDAIEAGPDTGGAGPDAMTDVTDATAQDATGLPRWKRGLAVNDVGIRGSWRARPRPASTCWHRTAR